MCVKVRLFFVSSSTLWISDSIHLSMFALIFSVQLSKPQDSERLFFIPDCVCLSGDILPPPISYDIEAGASRLTSLALRLVFVTAVVVRAIPVCPTVSYIGPA